MRQDELCARIGTVHDGMLGIWGGVRRVPISHDPDDDAPTPWPITATGTDLVKPVMPKLTPTGAMACMWDIARAGLTFIQPDTGYHIVR